MTIGQRRAPRNLWQKLPKMEDYALDKWTLLRLTPVLRLNCLAASTTVPAMKKSIILVSVLSVVAMMLVSCASDSDVDSTTPTYHEAAPAHNHIGGADL